MRDRGGSHKAAAASIRFVTQRKDCARSASGSFLRGCGLLVARLLVGWFLEVLLVADYHADQACGC